MDKILFYLQKANNFAELHRYTFLKMITIRSRRTYFIFLAVHIISINSVVAQDVKLSLALTDCIQETVFKEIEKQTGYKFVYNTTEINQKEIISVHLKNEELQDVLNTIFRNKDISFRISNKHIVLFRQRTKKLTGTIVDNKGESIIGANVVVKGTINGTVTDLDGHFSLDVPDDAVLQITYIGYNTQEIAVKDQHKLSVKLVEDTQKLDEVVVIGYSTKSQSQLSSSVSVVSQEALQGVSSDNISKILQGKSSGVVVSNQSGKPGTAPTIIVRGTGSIGAGTAPLYVVDGVIGGIANPNDIESVTILKDAAATGLYGSRAANGVIIVTTKSGKSGKTRINVDSSFGYGWKPGNNLEMMNSAEYYDVNKVMYTDKYNTLYESNLTALKKTNPSPSPAEIEAYMISKKLYAYPQ